MRIASVASAFPKHYYKQEVVVEALKKQWRKSLPNADILDRLDESMKVEGRYAVETIEFYESMQTWGEANNTWIKHGRAGTKRPERDLRDVGDGNSCTID
jgi:alkylresorcinol/alkylpyrone synthase